MCLMYKGTMRVLLILLHDFPEFLCNYHFSFCDMIPSSCIQMRNVILDAHPQDMRVVDPASPNLKVAICFYNNIFFILLTLVRDFCF